MDFLTQLLGRLESLRNRDNSVSTLVAAIYCTLLSSILVGSLYIIPRRIRQLERNDARQIKWRTAVTMIVGFSSYMATAAIFPSLESQIPVPAQTYILRSIRLTCGILIHTMILYLGPIYQHAAHVVMVMRNSEARLTVVNVCQAWKQLCVDPLLNPSTPSVRWATIRNLIAAPLVEEIIFRSCVLRTLSRSPLQTNILPFVAPLFFGVAHIHHSIQSIFLGFPLRTAVLRGLFQFAYTTVFGIYVSFAYLRTESLLGVILCHSFCNAMGLPDFNFMRQSSILFLQRNSLLTVHIAGVLLFSLGCYTPLLLPKV